MNKYQKSKQWLFGLPFDRRTHNTYDMSNIVCVRAVKVGENDNQFNFYCNAFATKTTHFSHPSHSNNFYESFAAYTETS